MTFEPMRVTRRWLPLAAVTTALAGLVFATVQQSLRSGANDPQVQLAEDAARALDRGAAMEAVVPADSVEIERSLAPFVIAFDDAGTALRGSGRLHGQLAAPPAGVFAFVRTSGSDRVTWQPERGVRIASVVVRTSAKPAAFVLAGRSLREVEARTAYLRTAVVIAWLAALGGALVLLVLGEALGGEAA